MNGDPLEPTSQRLAAWWLSRRTALNSAAPAPAAALLGGTGAQGE